MKIKVVVPAAQRQIDEITEFIYLDNPAAAERYARQAVAVFVELSDTHLDGLIYALFPPFRQLNRARG